MWQGDTRMQGFNLIVVFDEFAEKMKLMAEGGASILGGCCGTTPEHICAMVKATRELPYKYPEFKSITTVSSFSHSVDFAERRNTPVLQHFLQTKQSVCPFHHRFH